MSDDLALTRKVEEYEAHMDELYLYGSGPCYDYCACKMCWKGWWGVPFRKRLWWRIRQVWRDYRAARRLP